MQPHTYETVADEVGLTGQTRERYIAYMRRRWPIREPLITHPRDGYAREWAERFAMGVEYGKADTEGKSVLQDIDAPSADDQTARGHTVSRGVSEAEREG